MNTVIIDVREKDEFQAEHIENSISIPLSEFQRIAPPILKSLNGKSIQLMCLSGKRAKMAADMTLSFGLHDLDISVYSGGINEWKKKQKTVVTYKKKHFPLIRQVQLIAGGLVLTSAALSFIFTPMWIFLAAFVGAGLSIAGATGFCGMAELLAFAPWNRTAPQIKKELCEVSSASHKC